MPTGVYKRKPLSDETKKKISIANKGKKAKLKKEIIKIFKEFKVETKYSTHSELADFILDELNKPN